MNLDLTQRIWLVKKKRIKRLKKSQRKLKKLLQLKNKRKRQKLKLLLKKQMKRQKHHQIMIINVKIRVLMLLNNN